MAHSYFRSEPVKHTTGLDYWNNQPYDSLAVYWFPHTLGEIVTQCLAHGLQICQFNEYPMDLSGGRYSQTDDLKLPLSFSLVARRGNT
jgi:hypothetical protein